MHRPRLVLVRHGETSWSTSGRHTGRTDIPLTTAGTQQARRIPAVLDRITPPIADEPPPLVLSSPRGRARETARLAGLAVDRIDDRLAEWDYGDYEGITTAQIRRTVPGWTVWAHPCPGGETARQVADRADDLIAAVVAEATEGARDAVLVGHGHFSRVLMARWIGQDAALGGRLSMPTAGVAVLGHEHEYRVVETIAGPGPAAPPHGGRARVRAAMRTSGGKAPGECSDADVARKQRSPGGQSSGSSSSSSASDAAASSGPEPGP